VEAHRAIGLTGTGWSGIEPASVSRASARMETQVPTALPSRERHP